MAYLRQRLVGRHEVGDTPLVDLTRDRLHGKRCAASVVMNSPPLTPPAGQLQRQHLNSLQYDRDYTWNANGELIRISSPRQT